MISEVQWIQAFTEEVKYYMREKNYTQRELADRSRLAESTVSDILHGNKLPNIRTVHNLAYGLGVGIEELTDFGQLIE